LDNLLSVLLPIATEQDILISHAIVNKNLITTIYDTESEETLESTFPIYQEDPQKIGSAVTYAKRYNLGAIFNIITEIDDDGNSVS
jgi:ERF superfamily